MLSHSGHPALGCIPRVAVFFGEKDRFGRLWISFGRSWIKRECQDGHEVVKYIVPGQGKRNTFRLQENLAHTKQPPPPRTTVGP